MFLFLVALIGTGLRSIAYFPLPFEYPNLVHAHSHTAFQGWVYLIMMLLLCKSYLGKDQLKAGRYPLQFKLSAGIVVGVLISFSLQGYALYSILFSTLFQLLNYWFIYRFLQDTRRLSSNTQTPISLSFVKTGLWLGLLSTLFPFGIGILSAKGLAGTEAYHSLVYSFLHFQYNGWFLFVVLGLFFNFLEKNQVNFGEKYAKRFYQFMSLAIIPATSLSLLGMEFANYLSVFAYLSAFLLAVAFYFFIKSLNASIWKLLQQKSGWLQFYLLAFLLSFSLKMMLQSLSVLPFFESYAFFNKSIIIAYLHLSLIGSISCLLLAQMIEWKFLALDGFVKIGSSLLLAGFFTSELLLVLGGMGIFHNQLALITASAAMALGILLMILSKRAATS